MILEIEKPSTLYDKIFIESLKDRKVILNSDVDPSLIDLINMSIKKFNEEDKTIPVQERKPIELYISSSGGEVYSGFGVCNSIATSKTPVYAYCESFAMSMAVAIFACAHKRFAYPYSNFMVHEISAGAMGKNLEIERVTKENKRLQKMYDGIITSRSNIDQRKLDSVKKNSLDWFFDANEALKLGLVDEIIQ